jgi:hypothetical protein
MTKKSLEELTVLRNEEESCYYYETVTGKYITVEVGKNLHTLILFSKITDAVLFRTFGGFLHVPTTQIYCLTGAIISETHITKIYLKYNARSSTLQ